MIELALGYKHLVPKGTGRPLPRHLLSKGWRGSSLQAMKQISLFICSTMVSLSLGLACSKPPPGRGVGETEVAATSQTNFRVETVVANLEVPWSIVWAPDGRMFFTERPGRVRVYEKGQLRTQPFYVVPDVERRKRRFAVIVTQPRIPRLVMDPKIMVKGHRTVRPRETPVGMRPFFVAAVAQGLADQAPLHGAVGILPGQG